MGILHTETSIKRDKKDIFLAHADKYNVAILALPLPEGLEIGRI